MSAIRTRVLQAITRTAPKDRILGPRHIESIATAVVDELGDDLIDDDEVSEGEGVSLHIGALRHLWCQYCAKDSMYQLSTYAVIDEQTVRRVGQVLWCQECGYSPYQEELDE